MEKHQIKQNIDESRQYIVKARAAIKSFMRKYPDVPINHEDNLRPSESIINLLNCSLIELDSNKTSLENYSKTTDPMERAIPDLKKAKANMAILLRRYPEPNFPKEYVDKAINSAIITLSSPSKRISLLKKDQIKVGVLLNNNSSPALTEKPGAKLKEAISTVVSVNKKVEKSSSFMEQIKQSRIKSKDLSRSK